MPYATGNDILDVMTASGTQVVPGGMQVVDIWVVGAGGSGAIDGGGGGGAGVAYAQFTVLPGDWDTELTVVVGQGVQDDAGEDSTVDGALNGATFATLVGGGGGAGVTGLAGGAGGVASGGTTNTDGSAGTAYDNETDTVGSGGTIQDTTVLPYADSTIWGAGSSGDTVATVPGFQGIVIFWWRN